MELSREDNERLDRLASEVKKGGGLALPFFFSSILNEILDNGPTSNERIVTIVTDLGANKTKKLAETWRNSWEFLTADLMSQLLWCGYVECDGEKWVIGDRFVPGVRLETIPRRPGLNRDDGVTVWEHEEREQLNHAAWVKQEIDKVIRQPRGHWHDQPTMNILRNDWEEQGPINPVLVDAHNRTVDGRHRRKIDPNWPTRKYLRDDGSKEPISTDEEMLAAILKVNATNAGVALSKHAVQKIERLLGELPGVNAVKRSRVKSVLLEDASRSNRAIAELLEVDDKFVGKVRDELRTDRSIHRYEFTGGKGIKTGQHSITCWCGEGTAEPQQPKPKREPKPKPSPKWENPALLNDVARGLAEKDLIDRHNVSSGTIAAARAHLKGKETIQKSPADEDEDSVDCTHCPVHCG